MKILIAISSKEYSGPTLDVGMNIARAIQSSTTIVDVGQKISEFSLKDVSMANEVMESWDIDRPGVDVLEWAYNYLSENQFIEEQALKDGFPKNVLIESGTGRAEVLLKGSALENLSMILRNGDIIKELRDEVNTHEYDLTIIGGSGKRSMAHDMIQYIDSSIFVVNNFNIKVELITISKDKHLVEENKKASDYAAKMMRRSGVEAQRIFKTGDPVDTIIETAGTNRIIIMGASSQSPITKFFMGSKPLNVMENCNCPVLIVK